jgi:hypothetical protein
MKIKRRTLLIALVGGLAAAELVLRFSVRSKVLVEVVNNGTAPIENLRVVCAGDETGIPRIDPGQRGSAYVSGVKKAPLTLRFKQTKSVLSMINLDEFDAPTLVANGEKVVIEMADDGYRPANEPTGESEGNLAQRAWGNIRRWLAALP